MVQSVAMNQFFTYGTGFLDGEVEVESQAGARNWGTGVPVGQGKKVDAQRWNRTRRLVKVAMVVSSGRILRGVVLWAILTIVLWAVLAVVLLWVVTLLFLLSVAS